MVQGIYSIMNKSNYKRYIGSSKNMDNRFEEHRKLLMSNKHYNKHLQRSWNIYGEKVFIFEIVEVVDFFPELIPREEYWIDYFESYKGKNGYNKTQYPEHIGDYIWTQEMRDAQRDRKTGTLMSDNQKEKISKALKGKKKPEGFGENISKTRRGENNPNFGKHISDFHKKRVGDAQRGKKHTPESIEKMKIVQKGKVLSEKHKELLRTRMIGYQYTEESKKKMSEANIGRKHSKEHIEKRMLLMSGEKSANSKLKEREVEEIKYLIFFQIMKKVDIAKKYSISPQSINSISIDRSWKHTVLKFHDADCLVLAVEEGTNKNVGKLGSILIQFEHDGRKQTCNVGSGFSDVERELYYNNPEMIIGKIVTVGYFEITQNQKELDSYSMRFPTWKSIIRDDKTEMSMH